MNEAAKRLVAREARAVAHQMRVRAQMGAEVDTLAAEAWDQSSRLNPDLKEWNAESYFLTVFYGEMGQE